MPTRKEVYAAINTERHYQDNAWPRGNSSSFSTGEEILLIEEYARRAREAWAGEKKGAEVETLNAIRKIAGIAVRCMEKHGAQQRIE